MNDATEKYLASAIRLGVHLPWCKYNTTGPRWKGPDLVLPECNCGLLEIAAARQAQRSA